MIKSLCNLMQKAVLSSVALIVVGGLLVFGAQLMSFQTMLPVIVTYLGVASISTGLLVLAVTAIAVMLPKVSHQLALCQH